MFLFDVIVDSGVVGRRRLVFYELVTYLSPQNIKNINEWKSTEYASKHQIVLFYIFLTFIQNEITLWINKIK